MMSFLTRHLHINEIMDKLPLRLADDAVLSSLWLLRVFCEILNKSVIKTRKKSIFYYDFCVLHHAKEVIVGSFFVVKCINFFMDF